MADETDDRARLSEHEHNAETVLSRLATRVGYGARPMSTFAHIDMVGRFLAGAVDPATAAAAQTSDACPWGPLVGRIGAVALRAVSPATDDPHRETLLALLELWSRTPMADPAVRLRRGRLAASVTAARDEHGAAVTIGGADAEWVARKNPELAFLDRASGQGAPPALGRVVEVTDAPLRWGTADQLTRLIALVRAKGPVPWDRKAADLLAEKTGTSRTAAAMALCGFIGHPNGPTQKPTPEARKTLKVTLRDLEDAWFRDMEGHTDEDRLELLADVLPEDPEKLWEPGGLSEVALRLSQAWQQRFGKKVVAPLSTVQAAEKVAPNVTGAQLCEWLADPGAVPLLTKDLDSWLESADTPRYKHQNCVPATETLQLRNLIEAVLLGLRWSYEELPAGDPVREGAPAAYDLLLRRLAHPGLLLPACLFDSRAQGPDAITGRFGTVPYSGPGELTVDYVDDGLTVAKLAEEQRYASLFFRPAFYGVDARTERLAEVVDASRDSRHAFERVRLLRGKGAEAMAHRIRSGALPEGAYEADPSASAPSLVEEVAGRLDVPPDSAALYLQLLTLADPTDRNVRKWNRWTPARLRKAADPLVARDLVVRHEHRGAGRKIFLPGPWTQGPPPQETWKTDLKTAAEAEDPHTPFIWRPLPDRFTQAWHHAQKQPPTPPA
ncbi:hypothetical protein ACIBI3_32720 [Actinomadura luteofluorescens]|uniref:hypothetical protein n=1 Tax=Actinomadura luteofluorescens TaxID=46163 RepID=UPI0034874AD2